MPDWQELVSARLASLELEECEKQEVMTELAGHLQDTYETLRREGLPQDQAIRGALAQVPNWKDLQRQICAAKEGIMNPRTTRLWIPSVVTLGLSVLTLMGFALVGFKPGPFGSRDGHEIWWAALISGTTGGLRSVNEYTVWLMALPFLGALGAHLSSRAGGTRRDMIISGVFPALAWLTIVLVVLSFAATLGERLDTLIRPVGPIGVLALLVAIPGACLLLGVLAYHAVVRQRAKSAA
jgi:hypothetical protein